MTITSKNSLSDSDIVSIKSAYKAALSAQGMGTGWTITITISRRSVSITVTAEKMTSGSDAASIQLASGSATFTTAVKNKLSSSGFTVTVRATSANVDNSNSGSDTEATAIIVVLAVGLVLALVGMLVFGWKWHKANVHGKFDTRRINRSLHKHKVESEQINQKLDDGVGIELTMGHNPVHQEPEPICIINGQPVYADTSDTEIDRMRGIHSI